MSALTELLRGKGAHVDPLTSIEDVDANLAVQKIHGFPHSIADLVFHMNYWMSYELHRIHGDKPKYPDHNAESFPGVPQDWDRLKRDFSWLLSEYAKLAESARSELDRRVESIHQGDKKVTNTVEAIITQMIAHNGYHTGQVALIRRALNFWPPPGGSDTW